MSDRPHRAYELDIHIGGDTWEDVMRNFRELADHIPEHGPACSSVSGSPSCGHTVNVTHRPEMTNDRYFRELDAWMDWRNPRNAAGKKAVPGPLPWAPDWNINSSEPPPPPPNEIGWHP